jgi:hypothetical protein
MGEGMGMWPRHIVFLVELTARILQRLARKGVEAQGELEASYCDTQNHT